MSTRFGLQTFTIRRHLKSPAAIDDAFARLAELGLGAVELAYIKWQPETIAAIGRAAAANNITVSSSQITFGILDSQREQMLRFHQQLGCTTSAVSVLPWSAILGGRDRLLSFAGKLDVLGQWYRERGLQLCFHHHDFEFRRYGAELGLDLLLNNTSPENLGLELDTYWAQRGGRAPHDLIRDLDGRVRVVHLRDYRLRWKYFELLPQDTELGAGNLDISRIVDACRDTGVDLVAIEQATSTPFESVQRSVRHLRELGYDALF